jgi:hypothetical protein
MTQAIGKFTIFVKTATETSQVYLFDDNDTTFRTSLIVNKLISLNNPLSNPIQSVFISYTLTNNILIAWLFNSQWSFKYVQFKSGESQASYMLCPVTPYIKSGQTVEFKVC